MKSCPSIFNPVINPPTQRKRKLETPVCSPPSPSAEESSSHVKLQSVILDPANNPPQQKQKLETLVHSPPSSPVDEESSPNLKLRSSIWDTDYKLQTWDDSPRSPLEDESHDDSVGNKPYCGVKDVGCSPADELIAKVGLHVYNSHKETNLQFVALTKLYLSGAAHLSYAMTLDAFDPHKKSFSSIRTCVWDAPPEADLTLIIRYSSLEGQASITGSNERAFFWDPNGVNVLYKGEMPKWLDDGALTGSEYYELNESDLLENDWLHLYAEVGAYAKWYFDMFDHHLPVKVKRVVVQTKEDVDSSLKLKSRNAIFYLTFESGGGVEHKCIIRQTSDGKPQHMCLEVSNVVMD
ncbi:unnamed protein product [Arabis nemorensis]|uniref:Uncharacterized protein n=1 Tax=Arabis nemorensis TaxID=586526 RepID=A0A565BES6_9BRAS|nr:unnamed protein product [Arabis nemorensis]